MVDMKDLAEDFRLTQMKRDRRYWMTIAWINIAILAAVLSTGCAFSTARYQDAVTDCEGNVLKAGHLKHTTLTFMAEQDSQGTIDFQQGAKGADDYMAILLNAAAKQDGTDFITGLTALGGILAASQGIGGVAPVAAIAAPVVETVVTQPTPIVSRETLDAIPRRSTDQPPPGPSP